MTEKQGGSTSARCRPRPRAAGGAWRLTATSGSCSAPMSDAFFTLAACRRVVAAFFGRARFPTAAATLPDQRLKDKCGKPLQRLGRDRVPHTAAWLVVRARPRIATLIEMAHHTRFDITVGGPGLCARDEPGLHTRVIAARSASASSSIRSANVLADLPPWRRKPRCCSRSAWLRIRCREDRRARARAAARADPDRQVLAVQSA